MSHWWRAHDEAVDDPKLLLLSDRAHRAWFNLMCLASSNGGKYPPMKVIVLKLRMPSWKVDKVMAELREAGLIDEDDAGMGPHNWSGRQFKTDVTDPTNAVRQRRYRERHAVTENTVTEGVTAKLPDTETYNRKDNTADAVTSTYAFESGVIRLKQKDFDRWKASFSHLDLAAELESLSAWAEQQGPKWFHPVAGALAKRNREIGIKIEQRKDTPEFKWNGGIEGVV